MVVGPVVASFCVIIIFRFLTGLSATSGYSGKASGRFFVRFGDDFEVVFV